MKQTVTINLAGIVYHIDDDAYETLNIYLKSIESHLEASDSKAEIMQDIEARIAELFSEHMKFGHVEVVTINMVNDIIAQLGSPEMITNGEETEEDENPAKETAQPQAAQPSYKKKFYRDVDHQAIGGVCAGFAQLIGIDVIWVRLLMVLLFCLQGVGFIAYILLWLIVPAANTAARRLEMRGIEPSAENIKEEVERLRESVDENGNLKQDNGNGPWGCLKALVIAIACICCAPFILGAIGILLGAIAMLAGAIPVGTLLGIPTSLSTYTVLAVIGAITIFLLPLIVLIVWAIHRNKSREPLKNGFWITSLLFWLIAFSLTIFSGVKLAASVNDLEGNTFEEKIEHLAEGIAENFGVDIDSIEALDEGTEQYFDSLENAMLEENIEQLNDEFGDGASEGILEVTEE